MVCVFYLVKVAFAFCWGSNPKEAPKRQRKNGKRQKLSAPCVWAMMCTSMILLPPQVLQVHTDESFHAMDWQSALGVPVRFGGPVLMS